tara:strand:- start:13 stop:468 length:456 start_codon:yes stop_codon:yes gene_type:complete
MYFIIILLLFYSFHSFSITNDEYSVDITFLTDAGKTDIMKFGEKLTYRQFKGTASWKDSKGDYGTLKCMGNYISSEEIGTILNNYCQGSNKDGDIFWLTMNRNSKDYDGGIGKIKYIYGEGKFKSFINKKCIYAIEISKDFSILKQNCKNN